jgi:hypothetical protein
MEICCRAKDIPAFKELGFEVDPGQGMFNLRIDLKKWYETDQKALLNAGVPYFGSHEADGHHHAALITSDGNQVATASHTSCYQHGLCCAAEYNNYPVVRICRDGSYSAIDREEARQYWKVRKQAEKLIGLVIDPEEDRAIWPEGFKFEEPVLAKESAQ